MNDAGLSRRVFVSTVGAGLAGLAASGLSGCAAVLRGEIVPKTGRRVVVVGGGWAGATVAKYVRIGDPSINSPGETVPNLGGMSPGYFRKAIQDYASGRRVSPEMEPYAKAVLELGGDQIAQFFAGQRKAPVPRSTDAGAVARGRASSAQCAGCHGQSGKGDPAKLIPDLTGQPAGYLMSQLLLFKQEERSAGDEAVKAMKAPLKEIPDATMADLATYYSSLR